MKITIAAVLAALLLSSVPAAAQEPPVGGDEFDLEAAMREVSRLLKESEELLAKTLKDGGDTEEAVAKAKEAREAIDKLLKKSRSNGEEAVRQMTEILKNAPQCSGQSGQEQKEPDQEKMKRDKENEKQVSERDPKNSGDPKNAQEAKNKPKTGNKKPPEAKKDPAAEPDPERDWMALLPEKMRQAVKNGDWDKVPPKWRKLIEEYTKKMSDIESGER